jgi:hypothetical protein
LEANKGQTGNKENTVREASPSQNFFHCFALFVKWNAFFFGVKKE